GAEDDPLAPRPSLKRPCPSLKRERRSLLLFAHASGSDQDQVAWSTRPLSRVLLLVPLPDAQGPLAALFGRKLGRALLSRSGEAKLDGVALQLVNPEVGLAFGWSLRHGVVDGCRLLGRVDAELGLEKEL